ncbi:hypothetical protein SEVIR_6G022232v4 [Setaria viridis]|uniref:DUF4283 domain-containing protein n=1 Tax=Setaria viridis TaxID=4556 RepID=A0A4U6U3Y6_SETVI|nr:hypothetical protein SEVIR_6G022232v2 [Setaria viridis]
MRPSRGRSTCRHMPEYGTSPTSSPESSAGNLGRSPSQSTSRSRTLFASSTPQTRQRHAATDASFGGGIDICLHTWRSLTHALSFPIFYRVRLCLDGIPAHAWTLEIVERVVSHKCALQCIVTNLIQPADSRHIELWAWTADPSEIPKKVWLAFTHKLTDRSSAFSVSAEPPPESWQQGARYEVFIHVPQLEDYTAAARNLHEAVDNPASITPVRRRYEWRYGLVNGALPDARSRFPTCLPWPPREPEGRDDGEGRRAHGGQGRERRNGDTHGDIPASLITRGTGSVAVVHTRVATQRTTATNAPNRTTCKDKGFLWPPRRGDDDDGGDHDYEHPGHGRKYGDAYWGGTELIRRDRTRSPHKGAMRHTTGDSTTEMKRASAACLLISCEHSSWHKLMP